MEANIPFFGSPTGTMTTLWHELESRFQIVREPLSAGRAGVVVYKGQSIYFPGDKVAVKLRAYPSDDGEARVSHQELQGEHQILSSLEPHPNILRHILFVDSGMNSAVVSELCDMDLLNYVNMNQNGLVESDYRRFFRQLISAVAYLHRCSIYHGDIKLDNVFVKRNSNTICLGDFEYATRFIPGSKIFSSRGSLFYAAPELIDSKRQPFYPEPADIWACGVVLYAMVFGMLPFTDPNEKDLAKMPLMRQHILSANYQLYPHNKSVPPQCMQMIWNILIKDALFRPTAKRLAANSWLSSPDISPRPSYEDLANQSS